MTSDFKNELALQSGKAIKCIKAGGDYFYKASINHFGEEHITVVASRGEYVIPLRSIDYVEFEDKVEEQ